MSGIIEVILWTTRVEKVEEAVDDYDTFQGWCIKLLGIPLALYVREDPHLSAGDRVRITITKEPTDA